MKYEIKNVQDLLEKAASKFLTAEESRYFAEEQIETHLRKAPRTNVLKEAIDDIATWKNKSQNSVETMFELPSLLKLNFNGLAPSLKIKWMHDQLEEKAKKNGIAILTVDNSAGMHTMHLWTQGLAKRGLFALGAFNGGPLGVVPLGGTRGLLGTNPFTYAFPTQDSNIVIDMATSEIPYFEIVQAKKNNVPLRPNSAVDSSGKVTTDASSALDEGGVSNLLPMGGNYKGYAFNYLIEVMTGAMIGAKLSSQQDPDYVYEDHGGFLIAINISAFNSLDKFKTDLEEMNAMIRNQKSADENPVLVPGDNNIQRMKENLVSTDLELAESLFKELEELAN